MENKKEEQKRVSVTLGPIGLFAICTASGIISAAVFWLLLQITN